MIGTFLSVVVHGFPCGLFFCFQFTTHLLSQRDLSFVYVLLGLTECLKGLVPGVLFAFRRDDQVVMVLQGSSALMSYPVFNDLIGLVILLSQLHNFGLFWIACMDIFILFQVKRGLKIILFCMVPLNVFKWYMVLIFKQIIPFFLTFTFLSIKFTLQSLLYAAFLQRLARNLTFFHSIVGIRISIIKLGHHADLFQIIRTRNPNYFAQRIQNLANFRRQIFMFLVVSHSSDDFGIKICFGGGNDSLDKLKYVILKGGDKFDQQIIIF